MTLDLPLICAAILAFSVAMWVILDGFDLGVGVLFAFAPAAHRGTMMQTIAPVWDGNETWLVLGGTLLFSAFPVAYGTLLSAWYLPIIVFLFALVFRGVAFEFRSLAQRKAPWSISFSAGSIAAAFAQGIILGSFVQGLDLSGGEYAGGPIGWLTPFSVAAGAGLMSGYALLGAGWLILKTTGELQAWSYRAAKLALALVLAFIVLVSVWTPLTEPDIARRWFSWPNMAYLAPVPLLTAVVAMGLWRALQHRQEHAPFVLGIVLVMLAYLGLAVSLWPYIVPRTLTFWDAAAPPTTQAFILVGVLVLLPLVLGYTVHTYRVFRGKASAEYEHL